MRRPRLHTNPLGERAVQGFTLTEMLVTMLILALASTLMATGIPVAIDTYHRTVNSANAQVALSSTATVLRAELGVASQIVSENPDGTGKLYYKDGDGFWASIENGAGSSQGLMKQYYMGSIGVDGAASGLAPIEPETPRHPLLSDTAITPGLMVTFGSSTYSDGYVEFKDLEVKDVQGHTLARIDTYNVMTRFAR